MIIVIGILIAMGAIYLIAALAKVHTEVGGL